MMFIQFFIIAFALFATYRALNQFKNGNLQIGWLVFWVGFWALAVVAVSVPETTDLAARWFGVGRGADLVVYLSVTVLFYLVFRMFVKLEDMEREITKIVRSDALESLEKYKQEDAD